MNDLHLKAADLPLLLLRAADDSWDIGPPIKTQIECKQQSQTKTNQTKPNQN